MGRQTNKYDVLIAIIATAPFWWFFREMLREEDLKKL